MGRLPVFVFSLPKRRDRRRHMTLLTAALGLHRVEYIGGIPSQDIVQHLARLESQGWVTPDVLTSRALFHSLNASDDDSVPKKLYYISNAVMHFGAIIKGLESGSPAFLLLEDDLLPSSSNLTLTSLRLRRAVQEVIAGALCLCLCLCLYLYLCLCLVLCLVLCLCLCLCLCLFLPFFPSLPPFPSPFLSPSVSLSLTVQEVFTGEGESTTHGPPDMLFLEFCYERCKRPRGWSQTGKEKSEDRYGKDEWTAANYPNPAVGLGNGGGGGEEESGREACLSFRLARFPACTAAILYSRRGAQRALEVRRRVEISMEKMRERLLTLTQLLLINMEKMREGLLTLTELLCSTHDRFSIHMIRCCRG